VYSEVPFTVLVIETLGTVDESVAPASAAFSNPEPETVTEVAPLPSLRVAGTIGDVAAIAGSAKTVKAFATVFDVPLSSVNVTL
jgi:hypothetical protein